MWRDRYPKAVGKAPVAWSDTYWPSVHGSTNTRWQGGSEKSPLEKYDQAFNGKAGCEAMPWCSPLKNRTRLSEIGQTHDGYEECDGRGHRACEAWAA